MANQPIQFPGVAHLVGDPCQVHPGWVLVQPITCNCEGKVNLTVTLGLNQPPTVCPSCLNVYGVVFVQYNPAKNQPPTIGVGIIGKAAKNVPDEAVKEKLSEIVGQLN